MMSRITFGKRIGVGFAVAVVAVALMGIIAYRSAGLVAEASGWVKHTHVVIALLSDIDDRLTDAESADRGFALSGDETFLGPYQKARAEVPELIARLRTTMRDNLDRRAQLDDLEREAAERLAFATSVIETRRASGLEAAARLVATGEGRRLMARVRAIVGSVARDEERLLQERDAAMASTVRAARVSTLVFGVTSVLVVGVVSLLITRSLTGRISSAIQHLQGSAAELQTSASEQATAAKEQATATTQITATVRELLASSRQIAESTQRVARLAEQTGAAATGGEATLLRANEGMATIRLQVDAIVSHMLDLGRKSQQITAVLELINELSEQTNILAINATIEAAGAADEGRRFAAVADEIRKLADRVGASTKEIRALVDEVRGAASTTVVATEQGSKATDAGTRQFADLSENLRQIASLVLETSDASREIELSTRQQATAVEQVSSAMIDVTRSASEVESTSKQTVQVAGQLAELGQKLARMVRADAEPAGGAAA